MIKTGGQRLASLEPADRYYAYLFLYSLYQEVRSSGLMMGSMLSVLFIPMINKPLHVLF